MESKAILASLLAVQRDLKVEKGQTNKFGGYNYRSAEDIIEKAKPLCIENGLVLTTTDDLQELGGRIYLTVTATVTDIATGDSFSTKAMAREPQAQKGMSESQLTGTAESYAKKRALGNLFAIDDTKDPDSNEFRKETSSRVAGARSGGSANNCVRAATPLRRALRRRKRQMTPTTAAPSSTRSRPKSNARARTARKSRPSRRRSTAKAARAT